MRTLPVALVACALVSGCAANGPAPQQGPPSPWGPQPRWARPRWVAPPQQVPPPPPQPPQQPMPPEAEQMMHAVAWWLPNRLCDIFDMVRARARFGPGFTFSVRMTEMLDLNAGVHQTIFLGLHGPRGRPVVPWPCGYETFSGLEFGPADETSEENPLGPHYGWMEFGAGVQALIIGADVGVDPWEIVDFLAGIILIDPAYDDF